MKTPPFTAPLVCLTVGALLFTMSKAIAFADVAFNFACNKDAGFVMDPNAHGRVGYVTSLDGFGLTKALPADLTVSVPFTSKTGITYAPLSTGFQAGKANGPGTAKVVGVISSVTWNGGVGDAIKITMFVSLESATQVKALQQQPLKTTAMKSLAFWVANYDQEAKVWFEQFYPKSAPALTGVISGRANPELNVDLTPVKAASGIDLNVYKVSMGVVPAADVVYTLQVANSATQKTVKSWGFVGGTTAQK
jgi:hypothetical protein